MNQVNLGENFAFGGIQSLGEGLGYLVGPAFAIAAVAVFFYLLIGAFKFLASAGDKDKISSARAMITHAIIAFLLLMMMFLFLEFIPEFFGLNFTIIELPF